MASDCRNERSTVENYTAPNKLKLLGEIIDENTTKTR